MPHLNVHVDESRRGSYLIVGLSIHIFHTLCMREALKKCLIRPRMYVEGLLWQRDASVTIPCHYNDKFDCSKTNGYNIPQDVLNEVKFFFQ